MAEVQHGYASFKSEKYSDFTLVDIRLTSMEAASVDCLPRVNSLQSQLRHEMVDYFLIEVKLMSILWW